MKPLDFVFVRLGNSILISEKEWKRIAKYLRRHGLEMTEIGKRKLQKRGKRK